MDIQKTDDTDPKSSDAKSDRRRTVLLGGFGLFCLSFVVLITLTVPSSPINPSNTPLQNSPSVPINDPAHAINPEIIASSPVSKRNQNGASSTSVSNVISTGTIQTSGTTSVYENRQYKLRFSYPSSWRAHDTELGKGAFALFNFPEEQGVGKEGFGKGMNKIEVMIIRDPRSFYSTGAVVESEVAGQKAYRNMGEYNEHYSYAIELPSKPGSYVAITMYGAQENFFVLEDLLLSLEWI